MSRPRLAAVFSPPHSMFSILSRYGDVEVRAPRLLPSFAIRGGDMLTQQALLKIVYGAGWVLIVLIRLPWRLRARSAPVIVDRKTATELSLLALLSVGMGALPLVHLFTRWLRFADRRLPSWAGWTGAAGDAAGVWLLWRAHAGLGRSWSDSVQLRQGHRLVTNGVYRHVRHPMYAAGWLLGIAQALLLQNRVAGPAGLVSFALLYCSRVPREEQMMLEQFGEQYRAYMERTGRLIPKRNSSPQ